MVAASINRARRALAWFAVTFPWLAAALARLAAALARLAAALAAGLAAIAALFALTAWIGSAIPRNWAWTQPADGIEILVGTNGVHTELILPLVTQARDWRTIFPVADIRDKQPPYTHVAVSWGEREVFLNTPTWSDLTLSTALGALAGGDALLHVSHYVRPAPGADFRPIRLTSAQYARLVAEVDRAVAPRVRRVRYRGYFGNDVFYGAPGRYRWNNTCNQWTSDTLAAAGVKTGWWTPLAGGVMKWIALPPGS